MSDSKERHEKMENNRSERDISRRNFLKTLGVAVAAGTVLPLRDATSVQAATGVEQKLLNMAGYKLDRTEALIDGRVEIGGYGIQFSEAGIGDLNTHVFDGPQTLDVTAIGLHPFMLAYANEGFRDYSLLPIFPIRVFRHKSIFIRTDRGIKGPEDLRGKKVATPGFSSTSLTWLRGIVKHEYGVSPEEIQWVLSSKDSSAKATGKV